MTVETRTDVHAAAGAAPVDATLDGAVDATEQAPETGALAWSRWQRHWPNAHCSRFVVAGGVRWHVQVAGHGPAVLLVHGAAGGTQSWHRVLPQLAERHTVIAPDLPGHAFTGRPTDPDGMTLPGMARALAALLGRLGVAPRVVVGHSAGAAVLVRLALDGALPDARLLVGLNAALAPPPGLSVALGRTFGALFASPETARLASVLARYTDATARLLDGTGSRVPAEIARCYEALTTAPEHVQGALTMLAGWDVAALGRELHRLTLPTLLLAALDDRWVPARTSAEVARQIPGARFELVDGHGHLMHEEANDQTAERLLEAARDAEGREHRGGADGRVGHAADRAIARSAERATRVAADDQAQRSPGRSS